MTRVRIGIALLAVLAIGAVLITAVLPAAGGVSPAGGMDGARQWLPVIPLSLALIGLATNRTWGRWLGLAIGIAALPWGAVLTLDSLSSGPSTLAVLIAAVLLLVALFGRPMIERFEGRPGGVDWLGPRMQWLRWAMIGNIASVLGLLLFVAMYDFRITRFFTLFGILMAGLLIGVLFLARQKTAGLLLVWLCCLLILPIGGIFVRASTRNPAEAALFAALFLPGVVTGWATAFVFGGPVWRYLRS